MNPLLTTIYALSSGPPPSGIAIVRVSGPQASSTLHALAGRLPTPRQATRATLKAADGRSLDDALVLWFPAPHSATGEDVAEFHLHGGRAVILAVFEALGRVDGLRPAEPGEFSRRAFENGKLDLVSAEALDDLIHADTEHQRRQALAQLGGLLGDRARDWRQRIIDASALVMATIDFSDEGDTSGDWLAPARQMIESLRGEIDAVLADSGASERLREGLVVAIAGAPNVGKSTLLNRLARREVAIVSPHAGTTRDVLEVQLDIGGYPVTLIDTAGLREASDPVEQEGIRRAAARAAAADLVLWLTDGIETTPPQRFGAAPWIVQTKVDLADRMASISCDFEISAQTGEGMVHLLAALVAFAREQFPGGGGLITRARHRALLNDAMLGLNRALGTNESEFIAEELRFASHALGRLLGRIDVEDVLDSVFQRFCIGK